MEPASVPSTTTAPMQRENMSVLNKLTSPARPVRTSDVPATPASLRFHEKNLHHPSPNRTEAAAAMMHLLTSSATSKTSAASSGNDNANAKPKRRYIRKVPRKLSASMKKNAKNLADAATTTSPTASSDGNKENMVIVISDKSDTATSTTSCLPVIKEEVALESSQECASESGSPEWKDMASDDVRYFPFREYNRKEKSLGLLCENFLNLYRDDKIAEICLDRAAVQLGVERRRIYDIVNILESIHLVSRKSKNLYNWHGLRALPVSIDAMKQRYAQMQREAPPTNNGEYNLKGRRGGKSLSKLSQMFVQLFLQKEQCIIPLDQAAKQLIQMEDNESEEDRLLKTKIRRLYDVANVLVSVGLIEKLQLSTSRKPVFRWKQQTNSSSPEDLLMASSPSKSDVVVIKKELHFSTRTSDAEEEKQPSETNAASAESPSLDRLRLFRRLSAARDRAHSTEELEGMKTSQSCDSDQFDDISDFSQPDPQETAKRKHSDVITSRSQNDGMSSNENTPTKRVKHSDQPHQSASSAQAATSPQTMSLLKLDTNNVPIHPQVVLQEQQEQVRLYMQQYIREYVDYMILQQTRPDPAYSSLTTSAQTSLGVLEVETTDLPTLHELHHTPVSIPTVANRVTSELAGSIQDILFSSNHTSPQSVTDLFQLGTRLPGSTKSGSSSSSAHSSPTAPRKSGSSTSSSRSASPTLGRQVHGSPLQPKNLITTLQPSQP